jgi:hypothetical protein
MRMLMNKLTPGRTAITPRLSGVQKLLLVQGAYYLLTALWALLDIDSFQVVTGPKTDLWLVRTVAVLIGIIAAVLILAARKPDVTAETVVLAVGSAVGLTAVDIVFVSAQVIAPVYLIDAAAQSVLLAWWAWEALNRQEEDEPPSRARHRRSFDIENR